MTTEVMVHLFISISVGFFALFAIYVARKRFKELNKLRGVLLQQTEMHKATVDKYTQELKDYFESKSKLVMEFKGITDALRKEKELIASSYEKELQKLQNTYNTELGHRKSSEVRLGKISESLAPFLNGWPWDPNNFRFLGNPIDGIQFNEDELIFVEIKTGKSRLSNSQKWIKDLIINKKVSFVTFRIGEEGSSLRIEGSTNNG
jgi:predicted Holliday junction resolvase-like endonuclease